MNDCTARVARLGRKKPFRQRVNGKFASLEQALLASVAAAKAARKEL